MVLRDGILIASGTLDSYRFTTIEVAGFRVHDIKVTGPIDLRRRIPLFQETLRHSLLPYFFCIIDNQAGYENTITFGDLKILGDMLKDAGIEYYYSAAVTWDPAYTGIVKLAAENLDHIGIKSELVQVQNRAAAEAFILAKIEEAAARADDA